MAAAVDNAHAVLIVGAGPSGLMMAYELTRYSIPVMIIDKDLERSPYSRAIAVQVRTLEIFSAQGLLDKLRSLSANVNAIEIFAEDRPPVRLDIVNATSFFDSLSVIDQSHTEAVLEDALKALGVTVLRGVSLIDFAQFEDGINAMLQYPDRKIETKSFSYIVGADGAHSMVRKKMAHQFVGSTYDDAFILADVNCAHNFDRHAFRIFFKKKNFLAVIPMHGPEHFRLISVRRGERKKAGPLPTMEEFQAIANRVVPFPFEIKNASWVSRFFVQCRSAVHYQEGRIFLIGDAAHIHSPAGGQGMNTGLQDAFNLAFKLALVLKGQAPTTLLKTYEQERKPVGDFLIDRTDRLFKFMVKSSIWARLLRRFLLPRIAERKEVQEKLFTLLSQTAIHYRHGALCDKEEHLSIPHITIGARIPNLNLMGHKNTDLHGLVDELCFTCLLFMPANVEERAVSLALSKARRLEDRITSFKAKLIFAHDADGKRVMGDKEYLVVSKPMPYWLLDQAYYVIVRPDHHVFCLGLLTALDHVEKGLRNFLMQREL